MLADLAKHASAARHGSTAGMRQPTTRHQRMADGTNTSQRVSLVVVAGALLLVCLSASLAACGPFRGTSAGTDHRSTTPSASGGTGQTCAGAADLRSGVEQAVAQVLGLSAATLEADLSAGQTLVQIAQAQHVAVDDLNAAYLNAVKAGLAEAVKNGQVTQTQADNMYSIQQQVVASGHYPLLESPTLGGGPPGTPPAGMELGTPPSGTPPAGLPGGLCGTPTGL